MKLHKAITTMVGLTVVLTLLAAGSIARPPVENPSALKGDEGTGLALSPQPVTVDQITHNLGNIATTVDNYGYMGGYQYYGYPSGEWPRGSGRDYIGEIRYWMGAVTTSGDTLVANSVDDFQALPMSVNGEDDYKIYLSTDTSRYYGYDPTDTTGLSTGNPAYGWRVWDPEEQQYAYNRTFDPLATAYRAGGPTSLQDSHFRFADNALGEPLLGLELTHTALQWNYCYNEDFMFVILEITNTSTQDYSEFAVGLYIDIDVGGPDGTGENGRLEDLVAYDMDENLAWIYDNIGTDPGWGPTVQTGIMGTKILETPDNIGMTAFRSGDWAIVTDMSDGDRFELINSQQFDETLPPTDQFYIQCTRGIDLQAGKTVRVVYALVAGEDEDDFRDNATLAQTLYDNNYVGPQPPATPILSARASNEKVYLSWTDTSEVSRDPLTGEQDFVGYKLYRSDNQGKTWGVLNYNTGNDCLDVDYRTIAEYIVNEPGDPIAHSYVDTGILNGVEYWYCLAAFDGGDTATGVDPLQSGFGIAGQATNVAAATPTAYPAGFTEAADQVDHNYIGDELPSNGDVVPLVFDTDALNGSDYEVVFEDTPQQTYWHLINVTTGDTVLANQTAQDVEPGQLEIVEGMRVHVTNGARSPRSRAQTGFAGSDTTLQLDAWYGPMVPAYTGNDGDVFGDAHFRSTYELRYTNDSTRASWALDGFYGTDFSYRVPFEAWNTSSNQQVSLVVHDFNEDGYFDNDDLLGLMNYPYDSAASVMPYAFPYYCSWLFGFDPSTYAPSEGDVFTIEGAALNGPEDIFVFKADGVNTAQAENELDEIRVVPNPYFARYSAKVET
ncbi:hypothetical protein GF377_07440, partial [candidate division GN15 bacterium]|nr:hypothetical protein [candidate division GN15 bacterium]